MIYDLGFTNYELRFVANYGKENLEHRQKDE